MTAANLFVSAQYVRGVTILLLVCMFSVASAAEGIPVCRARSPATAVSSAAAAIAAAKKAWSAVYEKARWQKVFSPQNVAAAEPYSASLKNGIWVVSGKQNPRGRAAPMAQICASDGTASVSGS